MKEKTKRQKEMLESILRQAKLTKEYNDKAALEMVAYEERQRA